MRDRQMAGLAPTVVALYAWCSGNPACVAEFRRDRNGKVEIAVFDSREAGLAKDYYDHGVEIDGGRRTILPNEDPENFMLGLLTPRRLSYFNFADESDKTEQPE